MGRIVRSVSLSLLFLSLQCYAICTSDMPGGATFASNLPSTSPDALPMPPTPTNDADSVLLSVNSLYGRAAALQPQNLSRLLTCSPCGKDTCQFNDITILRNVTYNVQFGVPIANCQQNSTSPVTNTTRSSITLGETWSTDDSIGVGLNKSSVQTPSNFTRSKPINSSQSMLVTVPPGYMAAMTVSVQVQHVNGTMHIGKSAGFSLVLNQPVAFLNFSLETVPCSGQFTNTPLTTLQCPPAKKSLWQKLRLPFIIVSSVLGGLSFLASCCGCKSS